MSPMPEPLTTVRDWMLQSLPGSPPVVIFGKKGRKDEPRPLPLPYTKILLASDRSLYGDLGILTTDEADPMDATKVLQKANVPYIGIVRATFYGDDTIPGTVRSLHATIKNPLNDALFITRKIQIGEPESILDLSARRSNVWEPAVQVDYPVMFRVQESYGVDFVDTYEVAVLETPP